MAEARGQPHKDVTRETFLAVDAARRGVRVSARCVTRFGRTDAGLLCGYEPPPGCMTPFTVKTYGA